MGLVRILMLVGLLAPEAQAGSLGECLVEVLGEEVCEQAITGGSYIPGAAASCDALANEITGEGASVGSSAMSELSSIISAAAPELKGWLLAGEVFLCWFRPRVGAPRYERTRPPPLDGEQRSALKTVFTMYQGQEEQNERKYLRVWHPYGVWANGATVLEREALARRFRRDFARQDQVTVQASCSRPTIEGREAAIRCDQIVRVQRGKSVAYIARGPAWFSLVGREDSWSIVRMQVEGVTPAPRPKPISPYVRIGIGGVTPTAGEASTLAQQEVGLRLGRGFGPTLDAGLLTQQRATLQGPDVSWVEVGGKLGAGLRIHPPWSDLSAHGQVWGTLGNAVIAPVEGARWTSGVGLDVGISGADEHAPVTITLRYGVSSLIGGDAQASTLGLLLDVNPRR